MSFSVFSTRILAVHSDGITTTGAVFTSHKGLPKEIARATARAVDVQEALGQIIENLRDQKITLPTQVIVASDRAVSVRADLPVNPERPRPYTQMRELVRWEAELGFSDLPSWDIDAILRATGAISEVADCRIRTEMDQRAALSFEGPTPRYQDVALSLGEIDRPTRETAVQLRETLNQPVGEPGCGWVSTQDEGGGDFVQHAWLLSAISEYDREAWRVACHVNKLKLRGILPSWGLADLMAQQQPTENHEVNTGQRLLLEHHKNAISLVHMNAHSVESIRLISTGPLEAAQEDALHRILERRVPAPMVAVGFGAHSVSVIRAAFPNAMMLENTLTAVLVGAAARGLKHRTAPVWPAMISPTEPQPPIWKTSGFFRALLVLLVIFGVGAMDISTRWKNANLDTKLTSLDKKYNERRALAATIQTAANSVRALEVQIEQTQADIKDLERRGEIATYLQTRRQQVSEGLLEAIRSSIPKGVVMRQIEESTKIPEVFTLSAWSLTDIAAERFISGLNDKLAGLGLVVADEVVFQKHGPKNIPGYGTRLRITPKSVIVHETDTNKEVGHE